MNDDEERSPANGKPYYCNACGLGFDEYMACEFPDCELESEEQAKDRLAKADSKAFDDTSPYGLDGS